MKIKAISIKFFNEEDLEKLKKQSRESLAKLANC